ncbi:hypothetical protein D3C84_758270 [compost metagenome]
MVLGIFRLAETSVVEGEQHQDPDAHVGHEAVPPAERSGGRRAEIQPLRLVAITADRQPHRHQQTAEVHRQQHAIELVQPVLHAAQDHRHAIEHHQQRGQRIHQFRIEVIERHGDHRALEHRVIDRRGEEDQRRQAGTGAAEEQPRKQRHRQAAAHREAAEHAVDQPVADHRQDHADQRVARAVRQRQGSTDHDVEHRAAHRPPGHGQRQSAHACFGWNRMIGRVLPGLTRLR